MSDALENARPLFILGVPRSGTTMLARLLNTHTGIVQTYETAAFLLFDHIIKNTKHGVKSGIYYGKEYQELWSEQLAQAAKSIINSFYQKICESENRHNVRYWGDKHPHHNACLPFLERLYPNSLYVYIVRDPRDTICSIIKMNDCGMDEAFKIWSKIANDYEKFCESTDHSRIYTLRYEDIVQDYMDKLEAIMDWLDLEIDDNFRELIINKQGFDFHNPNDTSQFNFNERSVARWKQNLTPQENSHVLNSASEYMEKYHYI
ncbi:hypothetical protein CCR95_19030 [Thiocystis minor]|uniref:sulfotransferase family protein n=1 Tax=Thiocystis minor TaxID=61597 RepID=UPI001913B615|nr:sulfotransferase [Thiocystis minor]MBK5966116.1 hypothetical protein [Thiocystis minor]